MKQAENYNEGKFRPSLIVSDMTTFFESMVEVREKGTAKGYDRMNWSWSIGTDHAKEFLQDNVDSIFRHLIQYIKGESIDPESGCHHLAHVAVRCGFAVEYDAVGSPEVAQGTSASEYRSAPEGCSTQPEPYQWGTTKYDWSQAPEWARWAATDRNGSCYWYECEPENDSDGWFSFEDDGDDEKRYLIIKEDRPDLAKDWQNSLERRPEA